MKTLPSIFFTFGALALLIGMLWGIQMSATQNHMLSPAHGHLNLIGFVISSIFGTYYALVPKASEAGLAKIHFIVHVAGVVLIVPGIVMALTGAGAGLAKAGSIICVISTLIFIWMLVRYRASA